MDNNGYDDENNEIFDHLRDDLLKFENTKNENMEKLNVRKINDEKRCFD